ncbi:ABC transporter ATP-binding protein [Bifidobacterium olomucense]|uniref:ATP-binding protein of ABC transporter system n=1 Tax=Bifidobacterium olomucense TaxID=2675324 RepID=A0A7Y0EXT9_9BIFI|nr:ABC transporter ATP-binding protein [Bifidobacterium sp. DSM 109959]NMM98053.1 ATP-binding protein of ABC transporter system [Bifidobacterium sp. DSM 109959]
MQAIFYKDFQQLRHNTAMLAIAIIAIAMPMLCIATIPLLGIRSDAANALYQFAIITLGMCLAPMLSIDAIRSDLANGTILTIRACGRPLRQYVIAQLVWALIPITIASALLTAFAYVIAPTLRSTILTPQAMAGAFTPTLIAFALYLWSICIKGKALLMTSSTLAPSNNATDVNHLPAIRVTDMTFGYKRGKPVLEHINLDVPAGQSLGILGYNGVGKTTLFGIITGLLRPQHGSAAINGNIFHSMREVFQLSDSGNLSPTMTIRENLKFRSMLYATHENPHPLDMQHLDALPMVQAFELGEHLDKKVKDLSSGLKKRAGIVAGMLFDPKLILLDEPTNAVDPITRQLLIGLMKQLKANGRTILTITHDLEYCWEVTDRVIILDNKHLVKDCTITDFPSIEAFKQAATLGHERSNVNFGISKQ